MTEIVCLKFKEAIELLEKAYCSKSMEKILEYVELAHGVLESTYSPLKDDVYYANQICKELYCKVRAYREKALYNLECVLELSQDKGGKCCSFKEIKDLIGEAIDLVEKARRLLCKKDCGECSECSSCSDSSSCSTSSSCSDSSSCSTSSNCSTSSSCSTSSNCSTSLSCLSSSTYDYVSSSC
jgi:hypothetical protein